MAESLFSAQIDAQFSEWWAVYPLRVARGAARESFEKAIGRIRGKDPFGELMAATREFAESAISWDKKFLPRATTWLNQDRWQDDIEDVRKLYARPTTRSDERLAERGASLSRMFAGALAAADEPNADERDRA